MNGRSVVLTMHLCLIRRYRNKMAAVKQKVRSEAEVVYEKYLKAAQTSPRGVVAKLTAIVNLINKATQKQVCFSSLCL